MTGMLQHTRVCQVSLDEPGAKGDLAKVARWSIGQGVGTTLFTMGSDGCVVAQGRRAFCVLPSAVRVVDCYGADAACPPLVGSPLNGECFLLPLVGRFLAAPAAQLPATLDRQVNEDLR